MKVLSGSVKDLREYLLSADHTLEWLEEGLAIETKEQNRKTAKKLFREAIKALKTIDAGEADQAANFTSFPPWPAVRIMERDTDEVVPKEVPKLPKMIAVEGACLFPFSAMDTTNFPYCTTHNSGMCVGCMRDELIKNACRVACEHPPHEELAQHTMTFKDHAQPGPSPAAVEPMSLGAFDAAE